MDHGMFDRRLVNDLLDRRLSSVDDLNDCNYLDWIVLLTATIGNVYGTRVPVLKTASGATIQLIKGEDPGLSSMDVVPAEECRGKIELGMVDPSKLAEHAETEVPEEDVDSAVFDAHDDKGDVLRNLDQFYFCDEAGYVHRLFSKCR
ncbi:hypothetical protein DYB34_004725 [Aphanomyces astaci]|uniref:Uncharacterized protein n=1 Tax=Aphanomyces astaci TaxID=112090 RepID=A0A3R6W7P6_APHAT|nr:hypothetical protein DYB34_004725 [Aphanomyces astaci]